ncbi:MAG: hypothetical protein Q8R02_04240 [Hyphomonadaceae bacterium]|nr:hypothetical protein [Hyphomonadaceae bacterium]
MATTVTQSFAEFSTNTNITDRQAQTVSACRSNVVAKLKAEISLYDQESLLIGSYDRDTLPRYLNKGDVDVMVVMHYTNNQGWYSADGTAYALQKFQRVLAAAFPQTPCGVDRNCVTLKYTQFRLDVVPAFYFTDGHYRIPDTYRREWLPTRPKEFRERITAINKNMDGSFVPLVKMIKAWNAQWTTTRIRSFHLECMIAHACAQYRQRYSYNSLMPVVFNGLATYLAGAIYDPISGDRLDAYLDNNTQPTDRQTLVKRAQTAAKAAADAEQMGNYMGGAYARTAIDQWKALFGEFFPVYG